MTHPQVEALRKSWEASVSGDIEGMLALYHEDFVAHIPGRNEFAGDYTGSDAYLEVLRAFAEQYSPTSLETLSYFADDDHGVILARSTAARGDETFERQIAFVMRFRDGKVSETWPITFDQAALDEWIRSDR